MDDCKFREFQGKSLDEAIQEACDFFAVGREKLEIDIVQDAKKGIFGIGMARKALIRARKVAAAPSKIGTIQTSIRTENPVRSEMPEEKQVSEPLIEDKASSSHSADNEDVSSPVSEARSDARYWHDTPRQRYVAKHDERQGNRFPRRAFHASQRNFDEDDSIGNHLMPGEDRFREPIGYPSHTDDSIGNRISDHGRYGSRQSARNGDNWNYRDRHEPRTSFRQTPVRHYASQRAERTPYVNADYEESFSSQGRIPSRKPYADKKNTHFGDMNFASKRTQFQESDLPAHHEHEFPNSDSVYVPAPLSSLDEDRLLTETREVASFLISRILGETPLEVSIQENCVLVHVVCGEDFGLIIGREGQTLAALQYMTSRIVTRRMESPVRVQINVGDYRERQDDRLRDLALSLAERVRQTGRPCSTRPMSSYHRRLIHIALQDSPDVQTRSFGDGPLKRVIIQRKRQN